MSLRKLSQRSSGEPIDFDKDYKDLGRAHQFAASIGEALGVKVLIDEYKGNKYVTNIEEIHAAYEATMK